MRYLIELVAEVEAGFEGIYRPLTREEEQKLEYIALTHVFGHIDPDRDVDYLEFEDLPSGNGGEFSRLFRLGARAYLETEAFNLGMDERLTDPYLMAWNAMEEEVERQARLRRE